MQSDATTVAEFLATLPEDRARALKQVRAVIRKHLPKGYVESLSGGMIAYEVPLRRYPDTYNKRPLLYAALASQKQYMVAYLMGVYASPEAAVEFERAYRATGKRYDMGKSCVRFRRLEDLPLELIGETIAATSVDDVVAAAEAARSASRARRASAAARSR